MEGISRRVLQRRYFRPDSYVDSLCFYLKNDVVDVRSVHGHFFKVAGVVSSVFVCNNLIRAYMAKSMVVDARNLFNEMPSLNEFSWGAMISGYIQLENFTDAVILFKKIFYGTRQSQNGSAPHGTFADGDKSLIPNKFIFGSILKGCIQASEMKIGQQIHCSAVKCGFMSENFIGSMLVDMYGRSGDVEKSWRVFEHSQSRDVVTWTTMITCLANHGEKELRDSSFGLFKDMIRSQVWPVDITFTSLIKIFDEPKKISQAKQVHGCIVKFGVEVDDVLGSALIAMYGKCEGLDEAVTLSLVLRKMDIVSWTSLLVAYTQNGFILDAMNVFSLMVEEKMKIDSFSIASVLGLCASSAMLTFGKRIHGYALRNGFMADVSVANATITLYGKSHEIKKAETVFQMMNNRDQVSWTSLVTCYVQNDCGEDAISLFLEMIRKGLTPSSFIIAGVIRACSEMASIFLGEQIYSMVLRTGMCIDLAVENSLVTMYGNCGDIFAAQQLFHSMVTRDTISFNAMIAAYSQHGFEKDALNLFYEMQKNGIEPDDYTFLGVLVSCSHARMIDVGLQHFTSMRIAFGLEPKMEHYACMVEMYGHAGRLKDAMEFISKMPCDPDHFVWEALLASCMLHGDAELGTIVSEKILQITPTNSSAYVCLSNIHASMGMWDTKAHILAKMKSLGLKKERSKSWVEIKGRVHIFFANENSHPLVHLIEQKLKQIKIKMDEMGYIPDLNCVKHDIECDEKHISLLHHSEKLALAFALVTTAWEIPIRIMQNLRCCKDCHTTFKLVSLIEGRYIVLKDKNRFHHFRNGSCSCEDYW